MGGDRSRFRAAADWLGRRRRIHHRLDFVRLVDVGVHQGGHPDAVVVLSLDANDG
jgi:hypothetical protein